MNPWYGSVRLNPGICMAFLPGGLRALAKLFPDFERYLAEAGAIPYRIATEVRMEMPGYDPFPQRDFGWVGYSMSRPLLDTSCDSACGG